MCGRYVIKTLWQTLVDAFEAVSETMPELFARYNVAPTQPVPVIRRGDDGRRHLDMLRWGLIPFWARDPKALPQMINARAETAALSPAFRDPFRRSRCLMPADGFYEWQKSGGKTKQPFYIRRKDEAPFAFAAIWDTWQEGDAPMIESCALLTTEPNELMKPIHDRMPVIVQPKDYNRWLDTAVPAADVADSLAPYAAMSPAGYPVSTAVNNPRNDGAELIRPAEN
jgi:putative SOS response-associated peptidase YedK